MQQIGHRMSERFEDPVQTWSKSKVSSHSKMIFVLISPEKCIDPVFSVPVENTSGLLTKSAFEKSQTWVKTKRVVEFLDLTTDLITEYDHELPTGVGSPSASDLNDDRSQTENASGPGGTRRRTARSNSVPSSNNAIEVFTEPSSSALNNDQHSRKRRKVITNSAHSTPTSTTIELRGPQTASPELAFPTYYSTHIDAADTNDLADAIHFHPPSASSQISRHNLIADESRLPRLYLENSIWPIPDREEARLLRFFVQNLSRQFDLTDPLRHFATIVPQRAAICPTLEHAILAYTARHLSRIGEYDDLASNRYQQKCLNHLIPALSDTAAILDENLLASTIILRHLDEIEVPPGDQPASDHQRHLLGSNSLLAAQERASVTGGLRQAAFWVGLRQEIHFAILNQRSILPPLEHCNIDRTSSAASDHVWACRMVVLCADVVRYCYGNDSSMVKYAQLVESVDEWEVAKPASFIPVYQQPASDHPFFPEIWFVADEVVTGELNYHVARMLLSAHNPKIPRLGPRSSVALRNADLEIKEHVLAICGIALSNLTVAPVFSYAALAIMMAGDKFSEPDEQHALLEVLRMSEQRAWPTKHAQAMLKQSWGWTD